VVVDLIGEARIAVLIGARHLRPFMLEVFGKMSRCHAICTLRCLCVDAF
jgi:hypothetical protein